MPDRTLKVVFVGDAADAVKAARDMDAALANVETRQKSVSAATIATGVALGQVLFQGAKQAVGVAKELATSYAETGSIIHDLAQRTGFSTQALSEWKYAADQSGSSIEGLEVGIKKMNQTVVAANDGQKAQVETLAAIGVKVSDLRGLKPEEVFEKLTGGLAGVDDEATQAALATELFGRQGTQLLPILKDGTDNIAKMRAEAKAMGITFSTDDANAADAFGDAMHKMNQEIAGVKLQIGRELLPVLEPMVEQFGDWIQQNGAQVARDTADALADVAKVTGSLAKDLKAIAESSPVKVSVQFIASMDGDKVAIAAAAAWLGLKVIGGPVGILTTMAGASQALESSSNGAVRTGGRLLESLSGLAAIKGLARLPSDLSGLGKAVLTDIGGYQSIGGGDMVDDATNVSPWSVPAPAGVVPKSAGGLGNGGIHTAGGGSPKADPLVEAWKKITEEMQKDQQETLRVGGIEELNILKAKQADEIADITQTAQRAHEILGVDLDKAVTQAFQSISDYEKAIVDDRIEAAKKASDAIMKQMDLEAKLTEQRLKDLQQLSAGLFAGAQGSAFGLAAGGALSGQVTSQAQLDAAIARGNAATNARDVQVTVKLASTDIRIEGQQ